MEGSLSIEFEHPSVERAGLEEELRNVQEYYPDSEISIEEPKGAFPAGVDPLQVIVAVNASVQAFVLIYPTLREKLAEMGGETNVLDVDKIALEYLDQHTRVTRDQLDLADRSTSGQHVIFVYEYLEDGSEHYIRINRDEPTDWEYEER